MIGVLNRMQAQKKIISEISPQEKVLRPNIDHLIKRIIQERRQEKKKHNYVIDSSAFSDCCFTLLLYAKLKQDKTKNYTNHTLCNSIITFFSHSNRCFLHQIKFL